MGIFDGGDVARLETELARLREIASKSEAARKKLAADLAAERQRAETLEIELGKSQSQVAEAKRQLVQARQQRRASVARANRLKARLGKGFFPA